MNKTFNFEGQCKLCKLPTSAPDTEEELKCSFPAPSFLGISKFNFTQCLLWKEVCRTWSYLNYLNLMSRLDRIDSHFFPHGTI